MNVLVMSKALSLLTSVISKVDTNNDDNESKLPDITTGLYNTPSFTISKAIEKHELSLWKTKSLNITVFGTGAYATAIACVCARSGHKVIMLGRSQKDCDYINKNHYNSKYLKDFPMEFSIKATSDINEAITKQTKIIMHCIPTQYTPDYLTNIAKYIRQDIVLVSTSKGIHLKTEKLLSDIIPNILNRKDIKNDNLCYLSGPSFAKEMMQKHPIAVTIASNNIKTAAFIQNVLNSVFFRIYINDDVIGTELGGALKNPLAIGAGIASGLGYGQSTIASIVTRGAVEIQRMTIELGGQPQTMAGLCGFGDLMLTCFCELSRNRTCGYYMGKEGLSATDAQKKVGSTVEGLATAEVIMKLMKQHNLRMPLFGALGKIIQGKLKPENALKEIMSTHPSNSQFILPMQQSLLE